MISIIVPIYNAEKYLCQCVDSILNQTYHNIEVLLIDDGSRDRCGDLCEEYARNDNRIRVFHTGNKGLSAARNLGLREAKGDYIGFIDSDDWIEPEMYEVLLLMIENNKADISVCGTWFEFMNTQKKSMNIPDALYSERRAIVQASVSGFINNQVWNKLYKRECLTNIVFPEGKTFEDIFATCKILLKAHSVSCVSDHFYHYRMRENSIYHKSSMNDLKNQWTATHCKYISLRDIPEVKQDQKTSRALEKELALTVVRIWQSIYRIAPQQRDYSFLRTVSCFVQIHFPLLGRKEWNIHLRICIFFSRFTNLFSFWLFHVIYAAYRKINIKRKLRLFDE